MPPTQLSAPTADSFGKLPDGTEAMLYTLQVPGGWRATITNYGGIVTSFFVPQPNGPPIDIVLGFDSLEGYLDEHPFFGAICGRFGNRIADGQLPWMARLPRWPKITGPIICMVESAALIRDAGRQLRCCQTKVLPLTLNSSHLQETRATLGNSPPESATP